jgi:hypothetical protein
MPIFMRSIGVPTMLLIIFGASDISMIATTQGTSPVQPRNASCAIT